MVIAAPPALQDVWPAATCYGCGPSNQVGLHIKSYWSVDGNEVVCTFMPRPEFNAGFENVMYGGLVASLCDCSDVPYGKAASRERAAHKLHDGQPQCYLSEAYTAQSARHATCSRAG